MKKRRPCCDFISKLETFVHTVIEIHFPWKEAYIKLVKCLLCDQQILEVCGGDIVLPMQTTAVSGCSVHEYTTGIFSDNVALSITDWFICFHCGIAGRLEVALIAEQIFFGEASE